MTDQLDIVIDSSRADQSIESLEQSLTSAVAKTDLLSEKLKALKKDAPERIFVDIEYRENGKPVHEKGTNRAEDSYKRPSALLPAGTEVESKAVKDSMRAINRELEQQTIALRAIQMALNAEKYSGANSSSRNRERDMVEKDTATRMRTDPNVKISRQLQTLIHVNQSQTTVLRGIHRTLQLMRTNPPGGTGGKLHTGAVIAPTQGPGIKPSEKPPVPTTVQGGALRYIDPQKAWSNQFSGYSLHDKNRLIAATGSGTVPDPTFLATARKSNQDQINEIFQWDDGSTGRSGWSLHDKEPISPDPEFQKYLLSRGRADYVTGPSKASSEDGVAVDRYNASVKRNEARDSSYFGSVEEELDNMFLNPDKKLQERARQILAADRVESDAASKDYSKHYASRRNLSSETLSDQIFYNLTKGMQPGVVQNKAMQEALKKASKKMADDFISGVDFKSEKDIRKYTREFAEAPMKIGGKQTGLGTAEKELGYFMYKMSEGRRQVLAGTPTQGELFFGEGLASINKKTGKVTLNPEGIQQDFDKNLAYLRGQGGVLDSLQKAKVFENIDIDKLKKTLGSSENYQKFIGFHEEGHEVLGHRKIYPRDPMSQKAIDLEKQSMNYALKKMGIDPKTLLNADAGEVAFKKMAQKFATEGSIESYKALREQYKTERKVIDGESVLSATDLKTGKEYSLQNDPKLQKEFDDSLSRMIAANQKAAQERQQATETTKNLSGTEQDQIRNIEKQIAEAEGRTKKSKDQYRESLGDDPERLRKFDRAQATLENMPSNAEMIKNNKRTLADFSNAERDFLQTQSSIIKGEQQLENYRKRAAADIDRQVKALRESKQIKNLSQEQSFRKKSWEAVEQNLADPQAHLNTLKKSMPEIQKEFDRAEAAYKKLATSQAKHSAELRNQKRILKQAGDFYGAKQLEDYRKMLNGSSREIGRNLKSHQALRKEIEAGNITYARATHLQKEHGNLLRVLNNDYKRTSAAAYAMGDTKGTREGGLGLRYPVSGFGGHRVGGGGADSIGQVPQNPMLGRMAQFGMMASGLAATIFVIQMIGAQIKNLMDIVMNFEKAMNSMAESMDLSAKELDQLSMHTRELSMEVGVAQTKMAAAVQSAFENQLSPTSENIKELYALNFSENVKDYDQAAMIMKLAEQDSMVAKLKDQYQKQWRLYSGEGSGKPGSFGFEWDRVLTAGKEAVIHVFSDNDAKYGQRITQTLHDISDWINSNRHYIGEVVNSITAGLSSFFSILKYGMPFAIAFLSIFVATSTFQIFLGFLERANKIFQNIIANIQLATKSTKAFLVTAYAGDAAGGIMMANPALNSAKGMDKATKSANLLKTAMSGTISVIGSSIGMFLGLAKAILPVTVAIGGAYLAYKAFMMWREKQANKKLIIETDGISAEAALRMRDENPAIFDQYKSDLSSRIGVLKAELYDERQKLRELETKKINEEYRLTSIYGQDYVKGGGRDPGAIRNQFDSQYKTATDRLEKREEELKKLEEAFKKFDNAMKTEYGIPEHITEDFQTIVKTLQDANKELGIMSDLLYKIENYNLDKAFRTNANILGYGQALAIQAQDAFRLEKEKDPDFAAQIERQKNSLRVNNMRPEQIEAWEVQKAAEFYKERYPEKVSVKVPAGDESMRGIAFGKTVASNEEALDEVIAQRVNMLFTKDQTNQIYEFQKSMKDLDTQINRLGDTSLQKTIKNWALEFGRGSKAVELLIEKLYELERAKTEQDFQESTGRSLYWENKKEDLETAYSGEEKTPAYRSAMAHIEYNIQDTDLKYQADIAEMFDRSSKLKGAIELSRALIKADRDYIQLSEKISTEIPMMAGKAIDVKPITMDTFSEKLQGKIIDVIDADTFRVQLESGIIETIRLAGFNAYENSTQEGVMSTAIMRQNLLGKDVTIDQEQMVDGKGLRGYYGRLVANIIDENLGNVASWGIQKGMGQSVTYGHDSVYDEVNRMNQATAEKAQMTARLMTEGVDAAHERAIADIKIKKTAETALNTMEIIWKDRLDFFDNIGHYSSEASDIKKQMRELKIKSERGDIHESMIEYYDFFENSTQEIQDLQKQLNVSELISGMEKDIQPMQRAFRRAVDEQAQKIAQFAKVPENEMEAFVAAYRDLWKVSTSKLLDLQKDTEVSDRLFQVSGISSELRYSSQTENIKNEYDKIISASIEAADRGQHLRAETLRAHAEIIRSYETAQATIEHLLNKPGGTMSDGIRAYFLEMRHEMDRTAQFWYDTMKGVHEDLSKSFSNLMYDAVKQKGMFEDIKVNVTGVASLDQLDSAMQDAARQKAEQPKLGDYFSNVTDNLLRRFTDKASKDMMNMVFDSLGKTLFGDIDVPSDTEQAQVYYLKQIAENTAALAGSGGGGSTGGSIFDRIGNFAMKIFSSGSNLSAGAGSDSGSLFDNLLDKGIKWAGDKLGSMLGGGVSMAVNTSGISAAYGAAAGNTAANLGIGYAGLIGQGYTGAGAGILAGSASAYGAAAGNTAANLGIGYAGLIGQGYTGAGSGVVGSAVTGSSSSLFGGMTSGMAGMVGSLGYGLLGGAIGLPQSKYSGVSSSVGASVGFGIGGPIGALIGALGGGLLGGLFGGSDPDPRIGIFAGKGQGTPRSSEYGYFTEFQDMDNRTALGKDLVEYFDTRFAILEASTEGSLNSIISSNKWGYNAWVDPGAYGDTSQMLAAMERGIFSGLRKGLVADIDDTLTGLLSMGFFDSIKLEGEGLFDTFARVATTIRNIDDFAEEFRRHTISLGKSGKEAYYSIEKIAAALAEMNLAYTEITQSSALDALGDLVQTHQAYIDVLNAEDATVKQVRKATEQSRIIIGSNVSGLTMESIVSGMSPDVGVMESIGNIVQESIETLENRIAAEHIFKDVLNPILEQLGKTSIEAIDSAEGLLMVKKALEATGLAAHATASDVSNLQKTFGNMLSEALTRLGREDLATKVQRRMTLIDLDPVLHPLQRFIWALEDAEQSVESWSSSLENIQNTIDSIMTNHELPQSKAYMTTRYDELFTAAKADSSKIEKYTEFALKQLDFLKDYGDPKAIENILADLRLLESIAKEEVSMADQITGGKTLADLFILLSEMPQAIVAPFADIFPELAGISPTHSFASGAGALEYYTGDGSYTGVRNLSSSDYYGLMSGQNWGTTSFSNDLSGMSFDEFYSVLERIGSEVFPYQRPDIPAPVTTVISTPYQSTGGMTMVPSMPTFSNDPGWIEYYSWLNGSSTPYRFATGGIISGPTSGYTIPTTFHGVEHITTDADMQDVKDLLSYLVQNIKGSDSDSDVTVKVYIGDKELQEITAETIRTHAETQRQIKRVVR
jgi:endonuclease YncB( thermonuclease family)